MTIFNKKEKNETKETLGMRISRYRKAKGYTQEEFSQKLGVTAQAVSKWENDLSCPDIMMLPKIAQLFDVSVDELLSGACEKPQEEKIKETPPADISNLNLKIKVTGEGKKPVNVSLPLNTVKKFTKLGLKISGIVNVDSSSLNNSQIDNIFNLIDDGVTGEILNVVDENGQHIVIEIS